MKAIVDSTIKVIKVDIIDKFTLKLTLSTESCINVSSAVLLRNPKIPTLLIILDNPNLIKSPIQKKPRFLTTSLPRKPFFMEFFIKFSRLVFQLTAPGPLKGSSPYTKNSKTQYKINKKSSEKTIRQTKLSYLGDRLANVLFVFNSRARKTRKLF